MMNKKRIAVLFGGCSTEYEVSLQSAHAVLEHIDREKYEVYPIGITRYGDWYHYTGELSAIPAGTWQDDAAHLHAAVFSQNRSDRGFLEWTGEGYALRRIDLAFPVLHGKNGEDGTVQGLLELAGIPVVGCGTLAGALCMDKDRAHRLAAQAGVAVPKSVTFRRQERAAALARIGGELTFPVFVKPVRAGSSFGITRVAAPE